MFTTEPVADAGQDVPGRPERSAAPAPLSRLADPAWILATLWARWRLILGMALLGLLLAVLLHGACR